MAFVAFIMGLGLSFYILSGLRLGFRFQGVSGLRVWVCRRTGFRDGVSGFCVWGFTRFWIKISGVCGSGVSAIYGSGFRRLALRG